MVQPLAADLAMQRRDPLSCLAAPGRAATLAGQVTLRGGEPVGVAPAVARVRHVHAVGGRQERRDTYVDTDHAAGVRQVQRGHLVAGQQHEPAPALTLDADRLDDTFDLAVGVDPHVPDALQVDADLPAIRSRIPTTAVAVLRPVDRVEPASTFEPRKAGRLTGFHPPEERLHGIVETAQRGLLGRERPAALPVGVRPADLLELHGLIAVPDRHPAFAPRLAPLLEGGVVQLPMVVERGGERVRLLAGGAQQELERAPHRVRSLRHGLSFWVSMYCCTVTTDTAPTKYKRDHRVGSRERSDANSARTARDVNP
jgi:hypothetical protein